MKGKNVISKSFILKTISCLILVGALFLYNQMIKEDLEEHEEREGITTEQKGHSQGKSSNNSTNSSSSQGSSSSSAGTTYKDGTYQGTADGYGGPVTTEVTIKNGKITKVEVISADYEDRPYFNMCLGLLDKVTAAQSAQVDTVSGATYTSNGILGGVQQALDKAVQ